MGQRSFVAMVKFPGTSDYGCNYSRLPAAQ